MGRGASLDRGLRIAISHIVALLAVGLFVTSVGLDRDRAFYPTVTSNIEELAFRKPAESDK